MKGEYMHITRANYESWFVDYLEGNLNLAQRQEVEQFLKANPDLEQELYEFEAVTLSAEPLVYPDKQQHKKPVLLPDSEAAWLDEQCIAYLENDLETDERSALEELAQKDSHVAAALQSYQHTYAREDTLVFPEKARVKRSKVLPFKQHQAQTYAFRFAAAAAVLLLLISVGHPLLQQQPGVPAYKPEQALKAAIQKQEAPSPEHSLEQTMATLRPVSKASVVLQPVNTQSNATKNTLAAVSEELPRLEPRIHTLEQEPSDLQLALNRQEPANPYLDDVEQLIRKKLASVNQNPETITLKHYIDRELFNNKISQTNEALQKDGLWAVAQFSVKGLRKLTGKEIYLKRQLDENGQTRKIAFEASNFAIEKTVNN